MEWTKVKTDWVRLKPKFHTKWNKLTETDLTEIAGKRNELVSHLETRYHFDKKKAEKEADDFIKTLA